MKTKRFLAALLAAVMTFTCLGVVAFAALPAGAAYEYDFNSESQGSIQTPQGQERVYPVGWTPRTGLGAPTGWGEGKDCAENKDDKSWFFLIGYGNGGGSLKSPDDAVLNINHAFGVNIGLGGNKIKDETVVFDTDFAIGSKTVWLSVFTPRFMKEDGTSHLYPISLQVREGVVTISKIKTGTGNNAATNGKDEVIEEIGTIKPGEWHNVGAVIKHSSSTGVTIDIYFDSVKVYQYKTTATAYKKGYLDSFTMPVTNTAVEGMAGRYDSRGEYVYIDNFYIGDNAARTCPEFKPSYMIPADGSDGVAVDSDISVVMNQKIANADMVSNSIWLTSKNGTTNFANIVNETTDNEADTLTGVLGENLYYSEDYTVSVSPNLANGAGILLDNEKKFTFRTDTMFPVKMEVEESASLGVATAEVKLEGNSSDMVLIMATYDEDGYMLEKDVKPVAAGVKNVSLSVNYEDNETIKVFAVDKLSTGKLVAQPVVFGEAAKSYKQADTTLSVGTATTAQKVISVEGTSNSVRGWVFTKVAKDGNEDSDSIGDYLSIDAVQADDSGKFKFAGRVEEVTNTYVYEAIAPDSGAVASGKVVYTLETGNDLLSLKLGGKKCTLKDNVFSLKVKDMDVRGLLAEFTTSTGAVVKLNGEVLVSGTSRINCQDIVTLEVEAETEASKYYDVVVDVEVTDDYDDRNDNLTVIVDGTSKGEGEDVVDPGEWEDPTRVFTDVPKGYWAMEAIEALYEKGVVGGKGDGTFDPNALITREEFASMVAKAFGYSPKNTRMVFEDVASGAWYENSVYALAENGVASGVAKYKFGVGQTITRQDMTVMLYNIVVNTSVEDVREYKNFSDQAKISAYAKDAVEFMYKAGYVSGMEDGTFNPFGGTTKAMAAYMIYSIMN